MSDAIVAPLFFLALFGIPGMAAYKAINTMDSMIGYGLLAYWLVERYPRARAVIWIAAALVIALVGFTRLYLGVHYLSDVIAGYCAGFIWLSVCVTGFRFAEQRGVGRRG